MSDPLSIAASIGGLITLADAVFTRLMKYCKHVKEAEQEIRDLAKEINLMSGSLSSLARLARALEDEPFDPTLRIEHIADCHRLLFSMETKLNKYESSMAKPNPLDRLQAKFKWPFSSERIEELHSALSRHHQHITLALSADCLNALLLQLTTGQELVTEVKELRKITTRIEQNAERRKLLEYFMPVDPQKGYELNLSLRHPRTGMWLPELVQVQTWLDMPGSRLWFTGIPGAGKTVLAASLIEAALRKSSEKVAVAFFFCDYKDENSQLGINVLGALVAQLALQSDSAYALLAQYYQDLMPSRGLRRNPTIEGLQDLLAEIFELYDHTFVIVDGLDECGKHTNKVVEALEICAQAETISTAFFSRDEDNVRNYLGQDFENIEIAAHKEDIAEYVTSEIEERIRRNRLRIQDPSLKGEILESLVHGASGMFRWVACQLDHLGLCLNDTGCRNALKSLPPDLRETYIRILKQVPNHHISVVVMILNFIAHASPKLSISCLRQAVSVPENGGLLSPADLILDGTISRICSSLIRKSTKSNAFEFAHFSVQEFLEDKSLAEAGLSRFSVSAIRCAGLLAVQCLRFIQLENFNQKITMDADLRILHYKRMKAHPFYNYASVNWLRYARNDWNFTGLHNLTKSLFNQQKTASFEQWVLWLFHSLVIPHFETLQRSGEKGEVTVRRLVRPILHETTKPIHVAAMLHLADVCRWLIDEGGSADVESDFFGTPLKCCIGGLSLIIPERKYNPNFWKQWYSPSQEIHASCSRGSGIQGDISRLHYTAQTMWYIISAGGTVYSKAPNTTSSSLFTAAFSLSIVVDDYSGIPVLVEQGFEPNEDDLHQLEEDLNDAAEVFHDLGWNFYDSMIQGIIQSLDRLITTVYSKTALSICSVFWRFALKCGFSCAMNPTSVNSQVSRSADVLIDWGLAAAIEGDIQSLQAFLDDPRTDVASMIYAKYRRTILHEAMVPSKGSTSGNSLRVCKLLLNAGCHPSAVDIDEKTPLHRWNLLNIKVRTKDLEEVAEAFVEAGVDIDVQDSCGDNVLHANVRRPQQLAAILKFAERNQLIRALQTTNKDGYTPLSHSIRLNDDEQGIDLDLEASTILLLQASQDLPHLPGKWASPKPILELSVYLGSQLIIEKLLESDIYFDASAMGNPFNNLGARTSVKSLRLLKSVLPEFTGEIIDGERSMQLFLTNCLLAEEFLSTDSLHNVLAEIEALPIVSSATGHDPLIWDYVATRLSTNFGHRSKAKAENIALVLDALIDLGFLEAYETNSKESGLVALLQNLAREYSTMEDIWPIRVDTVCKLIQKTQRWSNFQESTHSASLLLSAFRSMSLSTFQLLAERGVDFEAKVGSESLIELMLSQKMDSNDKSFQPICQIVFEHVNSSNVNIINPSDGMGLIHRLANSNSAWQVEQLIQRGADPNLRMSRENNSQTPLAHHIDTIMSFDSALALIQNGADPTAVFASGYDAALIAAYYGKMAILETILKWSQNSGLTANWEQRCTMNLGNRYGSLASCSALHCAARGGHLHCLQFYTDQRLVTDIDCRTRSQFTAMHVAAIMNQTQAIRFLGDHGADIDAVSSLGRTPLFLATKRRCVAAVRALLQLKAKDIPDKAGTTALVLAYGLGDQELIGLLEPSSSPQNLELTSSASNPFNPFLSGATKRLAAAFVHAIKNATLDSCRKIISQGCPIDVDLSCGGCSPLFEAIDAGKSEIVLWLLDNDASTTKVSCTDNGLESTIEALLKSEIRDQGLIARMLEKYVRDGGNILQQKFLRASIAADNVTGLEVLLRIMDENAKDRSQLNDKNEPETIRALILSRGTNGASVLNTAMEQEQHKAVEMLFDYAKVDHSSYEPPAMEMVESLRNDACNGGHHIKDILNLGVCIDARGASGWTPVMCAIANNPDMTWTIIEDENPDWTTTSFDGETILHAAVYGSNLPAFVYFLRLGANPYLTDVYGITALHMAASKNIFTSLLLNSDLDHEAIEPCPLINCSVYAGQDENTSAWLNQDFKLYRRRVGVPALRRFANLLSDKGWSFLCRMAVLDNVQAMENLLSIGANTEHEGCPYGSALMAACSAGALRSVRFLVRKGSLLSYHGPQGFKSAIEMAAKSKNIVRWIVVDRFTDQRRIGDANGCAGGEPVTSAFVPWSGAHRAEFLILGEHERRSTEGSMEYYRRLMDLKRSLRGKVIPSVLRGRTCHPSKLIPQETVHISPGDKRPPR